MHTTDLPTFAPRQITPGETVEWTKTFADFTPDEWTVTYYFRGAGTGFDVAGTANPLDALGYAFTIPSTTTDDASAGRYYFQAWADDGAGEKHLVDQGETELLPSLVDLAVETNYDGRSQAKKILDAIDAMMIGKATTDQQEYMIGAAGAQRMLRRIEPTQLLELRKYYASLVAAENRSRRGRSFRTIKIQFDPTSQ
jgi:hypothetical protein